MSSSGPAPGLGLRLCLNDFLIETELARTAVGTVYKAKHGKTGKPVVLKARRSAEIGKNGNIEHEVHLLQSLRHPNIIKCYGSFWSHRTGSGVFYMVLEFAERGDLASMIARAKKEQRALLEDQVWQLFLPVMRVAAYLHGKGIIHRDIKALNVFLTVNNEVKVGDFGVGRVMSDNTIMVDTMYGTPLYLSPELCKNEPYNVKTDIWSCGVLLYELCALDTPFIGRNIIELSKNICAGKMNPLPMRYSKLIHRSVSALLEQDQNIRPSATKFLEWYAAAIVKNRDARSAEHDVADADGRGPRSINHDGEKRGFHQQCQPCHSIETDSRLGIEPEGGREGSLTRDRGCQALRGSFVDRAVVDSGEWCDGNKNDSVSEGKKVAGCELKKEGGKNVPVRVRESGVGGEELRDCEREQPERRTEGQREQEKCKREVATQDSRYNSSRHQEESNWVNEGRVRGSHRDEVARQVREDCRRNGMKNAGHYPHDLKILHQENRSRVTVDIAERGDKQSVFHRVSSESGPPSPCSEDQGLDRKRAEREVDTAQRHVRHDSLEWHQDHGKERGQSKGSAREHDGSRSGAGAAAGIPALKCKAVSSPWENRSNKSVSVASSASQRDALLSARRMVHLQRRQGGQQGDVRCIDGSNDLGMNARTRAPPSVTSSHRDRDERAMKSNYEGLRKLSAHSGFENDWFEWRSNPSDTRTSVESGQSLLDKIGVTSLRRPRTADHSALFGLKSFVLPPRDPVCAGNALCEHNRIKKKCRDCADAEASEAGGEYQSTTTRNFVRPGSAPWMPWT